MSNYLEIQDEAKKNLKKPLEVNQQNSHSWNPQSQIESDHPEENHNVTHHTESKYAHIRWLISFCDCCVQSTKFYCMDIAQALQTHFMGSEMNLSSTEYNLFYSVFAYIIIMPFLAGFISDRIGVRKGVLLFAILQLSGQILFNFGGVNKSLWIMLVGRLIFGFAALSMEVCEDVILSAWFMNKELTLALGLSFSSCRIGTAITSLVSPKIYKWTGGMNGPLYIATLMCGLGFIMAILMVTLDLRYKKYIDPDNSKMERSLMSHQVHWGDIKKLHLKFWVIVFTGFLVYTTFYGFVDNGNDILGKLYGYAPTDAGDILFGIYIFAGILTPLCGLLIDKIGKRLTYSSISLIIYIIPHFLLAFLPNSTPKWMVVIILVFQTISFSMYAAIFWGIIPLVVRENVMGTAFGIVYSALNLSLVFASIFFGVIHDHSQMYRGGYFYCFIFVILLIVLSWGTSFITVRLNKTFKGKLNTSEKHTNIRKSIYE